MRTKGNDWFSQFILDAHPYMFAGSYIKTKCQFKNNTKPQGLRKVPNHELSGYQHWLTLAKHVKITLTAIKKNLKWSCKSTGTTVKCFHYCNDPRNGHSRTH
jgi:hypothetical protein